MMIGLPLLFTVHCSLLGALLRSARLLSGRPRTRHLTADLTDDVAEVPLKRPAMPQL